MTKPTTTLKGFAITAAAFLLLATSATIGEAKVVGKNPGKIKGRWLDVENPSVLSSYKGVYIGELTADIMWKEERNEAAMEEDLLAEHLRDELLDRLRKTQVLGEVLITAPDEGAEGYLRLDCNIEVEPGSRAARWAVGMGAGKSRSILEIHLRDHQSGADVGLYHGHGVGSGMGFKIGGGGARKMTQDDNQENAKLFVKYLAEIR